MKIKIPFQYNFIIVISVIYLVVLRLPPDDLLRDVIAYKYNYNYSLLYNYAPLLPKYNQYIAFDMLLAYMIKLGASPVLTVSIIQVICFVFYTILTTIILQKYINNPLLLILLISLCLNPLIISRLNCARPEIILTCWSMYILSINDKNIKIKIFGIVLGCLLIPIYWLAILYTPIVLILNKNIIKNIFILFILIILNIIFWQFYSKGLWLHNFLLIEECLKNRISEMPQGENASFFISLLCWQFALFFSIFIAIITFWIKKQKKILQALKDREIVIYFLFIVYFVCAFNMVRYIDIIQPLLIIIIFKLLKTNELKDLNMYYKCLEYNIKDRTSLTNIIYIISISIFFSSLQASFNEVKEIPQFKNIPEGSRVLTADIAKYYVPFFNKNNIKVALSMEVGANEPWVQQQSVNILNKHKLDCSKIQGNFDYVVEKYLNYTPNCLELKDVSGAYRLWKVK
jgi:hypothetical protein